MANDKSHSEFLLPSMPLQVLKVGSWLTLVQATLCVILEQHHENCFQLEVSPSLHREHESLWCLQDKCSSVVGIQQSSPKCFCMLFVISFVAVELINHSSDRFFVLEISATPSSSVMFELSLLPVFGLLSGFLMSGQFFAMCPSSLHLKHVTPLKFPWSSWQDRVSFFQKREPR